jgi:hypothetical protein
VALFKISTTTGTVYFRGIRIHQITRGLALWVRPGSLAYAIDSHITASGNESDATNGCVQNEGSLMLTDVEISGCRGWGAGAIANLGWMYMESSSVLDTVYSSRNGAIANQGAGASLYMYNSTIAHNQTANHSTALSNLSGATTELTAVTIVDNFRGSGTGSLPAVNNVSGTVKLKDVLLARNSGTQCAGAITSLGYNYLGQTGNVCTPSVAQPTDQSGGTIGLSPLRRVGRVTRVMVPTGWPNPILAGIPESECPYSDQRGLRRYEAGANCEYGAVNRGHATIVVGNATTLPTEDTTLGQWLSDAGFDTYYEDDNNPAPFLGNPGLSIAVISTTVNDGTLGTKYKTAPIGIVVNKISALDNMSMVAANAYGTFSTAKTVAVPLDGSYFHHKIGNFPNLINNGGGGWGSPENTATWLVYYMDNTKPCVFRYGKGVTASGGFVVPGGRIAFPGWNTFFTGSGTADGKEIFYEAVMWASGEK